MEKIKKTFQEMTGREYAQALAERRTRPRVSCRQDEASASSDREVEYCKLVRELSREEERKWTSAELMARALARVESFARRPVAPRYREVMESFAKYFAGEAGVFPLDKGIILHGSVGCGKTTLFKAFNFGTMFQCDRPKRALNGHNTLLFGAAKCTDVADVYAEGGALALRRYYGGNMLFDDLGVEALGVNFGQRENVMARVIQERYDRNGITFLTTNLTFKGIQDAYGERVASRLAEMCSWLDMGIDEDYRR